jgi:hypothetical protein
MVGIGTLNLKPGNNVLTEDQWDAIPEGFKKDGKKVGGVLGEMVRDGLLEITHGDIGTKKDDIKLTVALVKETNDISTLEGWLDGAPGVIKGAIKDQIKKVEVVVPNKDDK